MTAISILVLKNAVSNVTVKTEQSIMEVKKTPHADNVFKSLNITRYHI